MKQYCGVDGCTIEDFKNQISNLADDIYTSHKSSTFKDL
jgi:hypothetical protein